MTTALSAKLDPASHTGIEDKHAPMGTLKVDLIKELALKTIRTHMPIATLFTPELKIDLGVFIKDQILIQKIAKHIELLEGTDPINNTLIEKHFQDTSLLLEITAIFKTDSLTTLYEACSDVLNKKPFLPKLKPAIEGRIFTLKNALIAVHNPEAIRKSQTQHSLTPQSILNIKEEGACFLRECLSLYLSSFKSGKSPAFQTEILTSAEQLIPFVNKITRNYLLENGKTCPENSLTFRNPTGFNHHGLVAATVMEACLNALGYTTKIMGRSDLEPKVTLATAHNIVMVFGPDNLRYLVDPSYIQFHKDVCLDSARLPTAAVLVLKESDVDAYIETNIMVDWRTTVTLVRANHASTISKLSEADQILAFAIERVGLPKEFMPPDIEDWVRKSFKRVWELSSYQPIPSNRGFQEIFYGSGDIRGTYNTIKSMGIESLTSHLSDSCVEERLNKLLLDSSLRGQNSFESLSLIAQLSKSKRSKYASLIDCDPRLHINSQLDITLNAYFRSLKKAVNPEGKDLQVIYGCAGADCTSVFLSTDAQDFTFVDQTKIKYSEFKEALAMLKDRSFLTEVQVKERIGTDGFMSSRARYAGASSTYLDGKHHMNNLALKFFFDLKETGVDLDKVILNSLEGGSCVQIDFDWQYYGASSSRKRRVTFISADITTPDTYPLLLKAKMEKGFDIFYMKGAFFVPISYPQFLPYMANSLKPGGWLMTADKTFTMDTVNPEPCLKERGLIFTSYKSEETRICEESMQSPLDPLVGIRSLEIYPPHIRNGRMPGSDLSYWSILSLRQKASS